MSFSTQDVYTEVAALVRQRVAADAAAGNQWAGLLHDAIDRKLVRVFVQFSQYCVRAGAVCYRLSRQTSSPTHSDHPRGVNGVRQYQRYYSCV